MSSPRFPERWLQVVEKSVLLMHLPKWSSFHQEVCHILKIRWKSIQGPDWSTIKPVGMMDIKGGDAQDETFISIPSFIPARYTTHTRGFKCWRIRRQVWKAVALGKTEDYETLTSSKPSSSSNLTKNWTFDNSDKDRRICGSFQLVAARSWLLHLLRRGIHRRRYHFEEVRASTALTVIIPLSLHDVKLQSRMFTSHPPLMNLLLQWYA